MENNLAYLRELYRRKCKNSLEDYITATFLDEEEFVPAPHHLGIIHKLEEIEKDQDRRVIIVCPPGVGKTTLISRYFVSWYLGRNPKDKLISASSNIDLSLDNSKDVKKIIESEGHQWVFPGSGISPMETAAHNWRTNQDGRYVASSTQGTIVGRRASMLLVDDPIRGIEQANSPLERDKVHRWFRMDAKTRLLPGGNIIIIQTRWHSDDLAGRLLASDSEEWELLHYKALDAEGKALWPRDTKQTRNYKTGKMEYKKRYDENHYAKVKSENTTADWQCLYQGEPIQEEGTFFKKAWIKKTHMHLIHQRMKDNPNYYQIYMASDYAVSENEGDYTVHIIFGIDPDDNITIIDVWREQTDSAQWVESALDFCEIYRPITHLQEKGQIEKGVGPFMKKRMRERNTFVSQKNYPSSTDKVQRARAIQARMEHIGIYVPVDAEWYEDFELEYLGFPRTKNDDQVDCLSLLGRHLDKLYEGENVSNKVEKPRGIGQVTWDEYMARYEKERREERTNY